MGFHEIFFYQRGRYVTGERLENGDTKTISKRPVSGTGFVFAI